MKVSVNEVPVDRRPAADVVQREVDLEEVVLGAVLDLEVPQVGTAAAGDSLSPAAAAQGESVPDDDASSTSTLWPLARKSPASVVLSKCRVSDAVSVLAGVWLDGDLLRRVAGGGTERQCPCVSGPVEVEIVRPGVEIDDEEIAAVDEVRIPTAERESPGDKRPVCHARYPSARCFARPPRGMRAWCPGRPAHQSGRADVAAPDPGKAGAIPRYSSETTR